MAHISGPYNIKTPPFGTIPRTQKFWGLTGINVSAGTFDPTSGDLLAVPIHIPHRFTFDQIACQLTRAASGGAGTGTARLAIYADNGVGYPGALIHDTGDANEIDLAGSTGSKAVTISQVLGPGLYWLALAAVFSASTTPQLRGYAAGLSQNTFMGFNTATPSGAAGRDVGYSGAITFVAGMELPDPFTASLSAGMGAAAPMILLRSQ